MKRLGMAVLATLLISASAVAQGTSVASPEITQADWMRVPTGDDMAKYYPPSAIAKGVQGRVLLFCDVKADGTLTNCSVLAEWPASAGFGAASIKLASVFRMKPKTFDGQSVGGAQISIPIAWRLAPAPNPQPIINAETAPWVSTPTEKDVVAVFPNTAKTDQGIATIHCTILLMGILTQCKAISAEPTGAGFEQAALSLARKFKADVNWIIPADGQVQIDIPIRFAKAADQIWSNPPLGKIVWLQAADPKTVRALFPAAALKAKLTSGTATVSCTVDPKGALTQCSSRKESPEGLGFGQAASQIAEHFVMNPWTATGLPAAGAHVTVPIQMEK
jgi:TonB family protein